MMFCVRERAVICLRPYLAVEDWAADLFNTGWQTDPQGEGVMLLLRAH